jgi:2-isopropylmalate synthase
MTQAQTTAPALHLTRWTVTSGSNVQSRGAVVIEAGDHHWRASAEGNGAVDALLKAVDAALADVLQGRPRLVGYDVHALAEGPEAQGLVIVAVEPPAGATGARSSGLYNGKARSTNIIAASIEAYVEALNAMLAEAHWAGAAETAGKGRRGTPEPHGRRAELDPDATSELEGTSWFDR